MGVTNVNVDAEKHFHRVSLETEMRKGQIQRMIDEMKIPNDLEKEKISSWDVWIHQDHEYGEPVLEIFRSQDQCSFQIA